MNTQEFRERYINGIDAPVASARQPVNQEQLLFSIADYIYTDPAKTPLQHMNHRELVDFLRVYSESIGLPAGRECPTAADLICWAQENRQALEEARTRVVKLDAGLEESQRELRELREQADMRNRRISELDSDLKAKEREIVGITSQLMRQDELVLDKKQTIAELKESHEARERSAREHIERLEAELVKSEARVAELRQKLLRAEDRVDERGKLLGAVHAQLSRNEIARERLWQEKEAAGAQAEELRRKIAQIYGSRSWRLTRTLRAVTMALRGEKGDPNDPIGATAVQLRPATAVAVPAPSGFEPVTAPPAIRPRGERAERESTGKAPQMTHVFTSVNACYIPKARVLAWSIKRSRPDIAVHLVLSDSLPDTYGQGAEPFDSVIPIEELPIPNARQWIFRHSVVELCTAVKGYGFQEIFRRYSCDKVFYFDPDAVVFSGLDELERKLETSSILLTPHQLVPDSSHEAIVDNEICSLKHGIYNLGFLGVRRTDTGMRFLDWWTARLHHYCYDDIERGLFTDQRWIDLAIAFFDDFCILRDPRFNVATWNLTHRVATGSLEEGIDINGQPLGFYHFSGFDSGDQEIMLHKYGGDSPVLFELREWYRRQLAEQGEETLKDAVWKYSHFENGEPISREQRLMFRDRIDLQETFPDPFAVPENELSLYQWFKYSAEVEKEPVPAPVQVQEDDLRAELDHLQKELDVMRNSRSWRLARGLSRFLRLKWLPDRISQRQ